MELVAPLLDNTCGECFEWYIARVRGDLILDLVLVICETEGKYLPFDCISGVFVGANFDVTAAKYRELVKAVNTHDALTICQCRLSAEKYAIDYEEIYDSFFYRELQLKGKVVAVGGWHETGKSAEE